MNHREEITRCRKRQWELMVEEMQRTATLGLKGVASASEVVRAQIEMLDAEVAWHEAELACGNIAKS